MFLLKYLVYISHTVQLFRLIIFTLIKVTYLNVVFISEIFPVFHNNEARFITQQESSENTMRSRDSYPRLLEHDIRTGDSSLIVSYQAFTNVILISLS